MNDFYNPYAMATMPLNSYAQQLQPRPYQYQSQEQFQQPQMATNKIFVASIDDVKSRNQPFNSEYLYLDNQKDIIYQKKVDQKGQFEVKAFKIMQLEEEKPVEYATKDDITALRAEINALKDKGE